MLCRPGVLYIPCFLCSLQGKIPLPCPPNGVLLLVFRVPPGFLGHPSRDYRPRGARIAHRLQPGASHGESYARAAAIACSAFLFFRLFVFAFRRPFFSSAFQRERMFALEENIQLCRCLTPARCISRERCAPCLVITLSYLCGVISSAISCNSRQHAIHPRISTKFLCGFSSAAHKIFSLD